MIVTLLMRLLGTLAYLQSYREADLFVCFAFNPIRLIKSVIAKGVQLLKPGNLFEENSISEVNGAGD